MIKLENTEVYGWEAAIRGMRNPFNSWYKTDTNYNVVAYWDDEGVTPLETYVVVIGEADIALMKKLVKAGSDHSKFMRMINVTVDITAPLYWWKEFDTYKVGTVRNSCSTMHKIADKWFTIEDFSYENLDDYLECVEYGEIDTYSGVFTSISVLLTTIEALNWWREQYFYLKENNADPERLNWCWWQMIQLLPSSYNQCATVQLNYAVLRNMYHARKNHKLDEWKEFCEWIETLPYSELITEV